MLNKACSASSYWFSSSTLPHDPPNNSISLCTLFSSLAKSSWWFSCSLANALPEQFSMSLVTSSVYRPLGHAAVTSSTRCWYCRMSSFDGSNDGTSEASWFVTVLLLPSPPLVVSIFPDAALRQLRYQCDWQEQNQWCRQNVQNDVAVKQNCSLNTSFPNRSVSFPSSRKRRWIPLSQRIALDHRPQEVQDGLVLFKKTNGTTCRPCLLCNHYG